MSSRWDIALFHHTLRRSSTATYTDGGRAVITNQGPGGTNSFLGEFLVGGGWDGRFFSEVGIQPTMNKQHHANGVSRARV